MALQVMFSPVGMVDKLSFYKDVIHSPESYYYGADYSGPWIHLVQNYDFSFTSTQDDNLFSFFRIKMPPSLKTNAYPFVLLLDSSGNTFARLTLDTVGRISLQSADGSGFSTIPASVYAPTKPGFSPNEIVQIQIRCWHYAQESVSLYLKLNDTEIPPIVVRATSKWKTISFEPYDSNKDIEDVMSFTDLLLCDGSGSDFNDFLPFVPQIEMADFSFVKAKPLRDILTRSNTCGYSSSLRDLLKTKAASLCFSSKTSSYLKLSQFTVEACIRRSYSRKITFRDNDWFLGWSTIPSSGSSPVGLGLTFQNDGTEIALVERKLGDDANSPVTVHMSGTMPPVRTYSGRDFEWGHIALVYRNPVMLLYVDGERVAREAKLSFINDESNADQISDFCWMDYIGACRLTADERYKGRSPTLDAIPFATGQDDPYWSNVLYLADFDRRINIIAGRQNRPTKAKLPSIVPAGTYAESGPVNSFQIVQDTNIINPLTLDAHLKNFLGDFFPIRGVVFYGEPSKYELTFQVKPRSFDGRGWKAIQSFVVAGQDGTDPNKDQWHCTIDVNEGAYTSDPQLIFGNNLKSFVSPVAMSDSGYEISIKTSA